MAKLRKKTQTGCLFAVKSGKQAAGNMLMVITGRLEVAISALAMVISRLMTAAGRLEVAISALVMVISRLLAAAGSPVLVTGELMVTPRG